MLYLRPHKLKYKIVGVGSTNPANGDYTPGSSEWSDDIECRFSYNTKARRIAFSDGFMHLYSFEVFMNNDVRKFKIGEIVRLYDEDGSIIAEMPVQGFHSNHLGAKIWL